MNKFIYTIIIAFLLSTGSTIAQNGQLKGKIIDAENNTPVPFATIIIDGTQIVSTSDLDGNFIFTGLKPGYIKLLVSYVGYKQKLSNDVLISNSNTPYLEIELEPSESSLAEVVVTADPFQKTAEAPVSMQKIGIKEIESNPGSNRDISRVIQSFPGVGSTPAFRNDVIIRGGGPSENRFFLDDVEIPVLNHFSTQGASGGPVGIINADFIKSVDFYSGSFPANRYNALSGVFNFEQKEGNKEKTNIQAALGASESSLTLDGPLGEKTSYIFSVRRSYLQFLFSVLELPFLPTFNDYQFKLKTNFDSKNQLTIISLGSLDKLSLNNSIENPDASQEYILAQIPVNNQWSYTFGAVYKHFTKTGNHTLVLSRNMLENSFYKYPDNNELLPKSFDYLSSEAENKLRYESNFRVNNIKINLAANLEYAKYYNSTSQQIFVSDILRNFEYKTNLDIIKYGLSAQASKRILNQKLLMSLGIRTDANDYNNQTSNLLNQFSPRAALSYSLDKNTSINMGAGRFFQQAAYTTLGFRNIYGGLANIETAKYIGANHINFGLSRKLSKTILISAEGFYKQYFRYPIDINTGASLANQGAAYSGIAGAAEVEFTGKGQAKGIEILSRINTKSFSFLASYTFVRSLFTDINNELLPSSWDSKHLLTVTSSKEMKKNWRIGFKWRFVGGLPYTPYDMEKSANIMAWNANGQAYYNFDQLNSLRFKAFHQLDLRVDKNFFFKKWSLMLYLDIQNAYNFQNTNQEFVLREKNDDGSYKTNTAGTEYILRSEENISGTVLPAIGIMIKF